MAEILDFLVAQLYFRVQVIYLAQMRRDCLLQFERVLLQLSCFLLLCQIFQLIEFGISLSLLLYLSQDRDTIFCLFFYSLHGNYLVTLLVFDCLIFSGELPHVILEFDIVFLLGYICCLIAFECLIDKIGFKSDLLFILMKLKHDLIIFVYFEPGILK